MKSLRVLMNEIMVGTLEKTTTGGLIFTYDKNWLETPGARPLSLSLPLISQQFTGDLVYNFFDNLLPDNPQIRSRLQASFQAPTDQAFDLLSYIGKDCVGAIQLLADEVKHSPKKILCRPLRKKEIATLLHDIKNHPLGINYLTDEFRISIAGAQEKTALLFWQGRWCLPLGTTPTTHIIKLPIGFIQHHNIDLSDSCENEWLCGRIAAAFGLTVAAGEIHYFENMKALVVKRFDRKLSKDGKRLLRLPQEDMCQALGTSSHLKYQAEGGPGIQHIMKLLLGSADAINDRDRFFKSQILFCLLAAIDGHAKNFSIFIEADGKYRLTPLYDILSAFPLIKNKQLQGKKIKMAMALKGENNHYHWYELQRRHFLSMAKAANYSVEKAEKILDEMLAMVDSVIEKVSKKLPAKFPNHIAQPIFEGMLQVRQRLQREK